MQCCLRSMKCRGGDGVTFAQCKHPECHKTFAFFAEMLAEEVNDTYKQKTIKSPAVVKIGPKCVRKRVWKIGRYNLSITLPLKELRSKLLSCMVGHKRSKRNRSEKSVSESRRYRVGHGINGRVTGLNSTSAAS